MSVTTSSSSRWNQFCNTLAADKLIALLLRKNLRRRTPFVLR
jgi:hypothetical protein